MTPETAPVRISSKPLPPPRARQAVLLVGGKATRLKDLAHKTPKALMEIGEGRVFLDLLIHNVARQGFDKILLLAGHLGEQLVERYEGRLMRGANLSVAIEPEPKGTGGALRWSRDKLDPTFSSSTATPTSTCLIARWRPRCIAIHSRSRPWPCATSKTPAATAP